MKKITTLLFIVFFISNAFSQEIQLSAERLKYFGYTNLAELAISKGDYKNAIALYDSALRLVSNPNYRDLYNLALCHKNAGNGNTADSLFAFLLGKGYGKSYISSCYDTTKNIIPRMKPILVNGKNLDNILVDIFKENQRAISVRTQSMEAYSRIIINGAKRIMSLAQQVDNLFMLDVEGYLLYPIYHFLQLKAVAETVREDSTFRKQWIQFRFLEKVDVDSIKFYDFLKGQVAKGNFDRYAFISHLSGKRYDFGYPVNQFNEYIIVRYPDVICKDILQSINHSRESFGLESYEDYFKKSRFTDSLLTNGKAFTPIPLEKYPEMIEESHLKCNFRIVMNYRFMMGFSEPEDAKNAYEKELKKLCSKKDNP